MLGGNWHILVVKEKKTTPTQHNTYATRRDRSIHHSTIYSVTKPWSNQYALRRPYQPTIGRTVVPGEDMAHGNRMHREYTSLTYVALQLLEKHTHLFICIWLSIWGSGWTIVTAYPSRWGRRTESWDEVENPPERNSEPDCP